MAIEGARTQEYTWKRHRGAYTPPLAPSVAGSKQRGAQPNDHRPSHHRGPDMLKPKKLISFYAFLMLLRRVDASPSSRTLSFFM